LVPHPVATLDGRWVTEVDMPDGGQRYPCRLTRWVPGRILGRGERLVHFSRLGELMAGLHNHARTFHPPEGFRRRRWDAGALRQRLALIEDAAREGLLPAEQRDVFRMAAGQGETLMRDLDTRDDTFGLIHADLGGDNRLYHAGRAGAIDFEMCGFGYYLCDLAEVLWGVQHVRHFPQIREALLSGYRRIRNLPPDLKQRVGTAIAIAAVTTVGFLIQQRRDDLPQLASYCVEHLRKPVGCSV
jgi:Ser/Thr protein kinase RdoA (MazF antagonist)